MLDFDLEALSGPEAGLLQPTARDFEGKDMAQKRRFLGRTTRCPSCSHEVAYSWLSGMAGPHLHFYANDNNDVLVRAAWFAGVDALLQQGAAESSVLAAIDSLLKGLPNATSEYAVWNNVKCPRCQNEFPYRFKGNLKLRLEDSAVILIDGCQLDTDEGVFVIEVDAAS